MSGGKLSSISGSFYTVIVDWYPPLERCMSQALGMFFSEHKGVSTWGGPLLEELSGGNWMAVVGVPASMWVSCTGRVPPCLGGIPTSEPKFCPRFGEGWPRGSLLSWSHFGGTQLYLPSLPVFKIVTWLILPVVICLSQRLSHACLSISNLYGETANGSLNQL